jgi:hypothetical protein
MARIVVIFLLYGNCSNDVFTSLDGFLLWLVMDYRNLDQLWLM